MTGLSPGPAGRARPRPALLVAGPDPASDRDVHAALNQDGMQRAADLGTAERAAAEFLAELGIDLDREERRAAPARMARAYAELLAVRPFRLTAFPNDVRSGSSRCGCRRNQQ
jgi:GTP cyclohydrolase I